MVSILILGGTQQIGRLFLEEFGDNKDYDITLFNRNKTNPHLFKSYKRIVGDRNTNDIAKLFNKKWDIVLDTSCYNPYSLQFFLKNMKHNIGRYIFISTISVYDYDQNKNAPKLIAENFPRKNYKKEELDANGLKFYAQKKVFAEDLLINSGLVDFIILRPHFIYGKYDWQSLDYYWYYRLEKVDRIVLPDNGGDLICWSYVKDLVQIVNKCITIPNHQNIYNITTHEPVSMVEFTDIISSIKNKEFQKIYIPSDYLLQKGIKPITGIPLWSNGSHFIFDSSKLVNDFNHTFIPYKTSLTDTYNGYKAKGFENEARFGIKIAKEESLIEEYQSMK